MFKLSARSEYALLLMRYLLDRPDGVHPIREISKELQISETLLRKVTSSLENAGLVSVQFGRTGGVKSAKSTVTLYELLIAAGEDLSLTLCAKKDACSQEATCQVSPSLKKIQRGVEALLRITKI